MSADPNIDATTYAVILAALDLDLPPQGVLAASAALARMFDARVVGAAAGECSISPYFAEGPVADKFLAEAATDLRTQIKSLERQFRHAHAGQGERVEWRCAERLPDGFVVSAAGAADLIVVGRPSPQANLMRDADVVVAGAFGHSRFMEWLLGGVTRYLLRSPNVNVLFSH
jgi:nucleotide-binding universal stress UspA family protein